MENYLYDVSVYVPHILRDVTDVKLVKELCQKYDANHHEGWSSCGLMFLSDSIDKELWGGCTYSANVKQCQLLEFVRQLPKNIIIDEINYLPNMKSNGWVQTDDLNAKYYDDDHYAPCLRPVYISDKREFEVESCYNAEKNEKGTQTECDNDEFAGSECGTQCEDKYDTEYSLEMWNYYRKESIIYSNPYNGNNVTCNEMKLSLSPMEETVIEICKSFEENIRKYIKPDYEVCI